MTPEEPLSPAWVHLGYLADEDIVRKIESARTSLRFIGPGCSTKIADALVSAWRNLGRRCVQIVLNADPELCRIGFGDGDALQILTSAASEMGSTVYWQPGIRLCVLEVDGERLVYPPAPRLVESADVVKGEIVLSPTIQEAIQDQILSPPEAPLQVLDPQTVSHVTADLKKSPPQNFDLSRKVRVLSASFQFVELSLENAAFDRKRAKVPPAMLGIGHDDPSARELLHASFQLISKADEVSGNHLMEKRAEIAKTYTIPVGHYGRIIRQDNREAFENEVAELRKSMESFQKDAEKKLQSAIDKNSAVLTERFLPRLLGKVPSEWVSNLGPHPTEGAARAFLATELQRTFGDASSHMTKMELRLTFKNVTASTLEEPDFRKRLARAKLDIDSMYEQFEAARARFEPTAGS